MTMSKKSKLTKIPESLILFLLLTGFVLLSGVSYFMFNAYKSRVPVAVQEVKGTKDDWSFENPPGPLFQVSYRQERR